jgi:hypothetical protein
LFARGSRENWYCWGNQAHDYYPEWDTYKNHSQIKNNKGKKIVYPRQPEQPTSQGKRIIILTLE